MPSVTLVNSNGVQQVVSSMGEFDFFNDRGFVPMGGMSVADAVATLKDPETNLGDNGMAALRAASVSAVKDAITAGDIVVGAGISVRDNGDGTATLVAA